MSLKTANDDYQSIVESDNLPAPKEYASKLALLEPRLLSAHVNLTKRLNARREFIDQLISLTRSNEVLLNEDEELLKELDAKKAKVHELKTELVDMIGEDAVDTVSSNSRSETPIDNWASRGSGRNLGEVHSNSMMKQKQMRLGLAQQLHLHHLYKVEITHLEDFQL